MTTPDFPKRTLEECNRILTAGYAPPFRPRFSSPLTLSSPHSGWETVTKTIKGRTIRTYKNLPASIRDLWAASAVRFPSSQPRPPLSCLALAALTSPSQAFGDKQFLVYETERLSFVQTHAKVSKLASLLHERGVKKGDRVAIAMRNLPEWYARPSSFPLTPIGGGCADGATKQDHRVVRRPLTRRRPRLRQRVALARRVLSLLEHH